MAVTSASPSPGDAVEGQPMSSTPYEPREIMLGLMLRGLCHPRHSLAKPRCCRTRALLEESQKPSYGFSVLSSHAGVREMGESLLPRSILIGRAQMEPISVKLLNAPSVPAQRGCCLPPAHISSSPQRQQRIRNTKFELSRNPRALLIDCLLRVIIIIKSDFRNCK